MRKTNEQKLDRLFAPSCGDAKQMYIGIRAYKDKSWWLRDTYDDPFSPCAYYISSWNANEYTISVTPYDPIYARPAFLLNEEDYRWTIFKGDKIELSLENGRTAKFVYACDTNDHKKLMLAADDMLFYRTRYSYYRRDYEHSDLREVMQKTEKLFTPRALSCMLPVEVRGYSIIAQSPAQKMQNAETKQNGGNGVAAQNKQTKRNFASVDPDGLTEKERMLYQEYTTKRELRKAEFEKSIQKATDQGADIENVRAMLAAFDKQEKSAKTPQIEAILKKIK
jgi:hypothetical protein